MNRYRCDSCGCYLDPGEGRMCEECRNKERQHIEQARRIQAAIRLEGQQYEFNFKEEKHELIRN